VSHAVKGIYPRKRVMMNAFSHLGFDEWFTIGAIGLFALAPFIAVALEHAVEKAKASINKKLQPHGLRLRQR
jgi:hypothetical protein